MKLVKSLMIMIAFLLVVTGCSDSKENSEAVSMINEASENTAALENGEYTYTFSSSTANENSVIQEGSGTFVNLGNEMDWYTKTFVGQQNTPSRTLTEEVQISGNQHQRFGLVNENDEYIEQNSVSAWQKTTEERSDFPLYIEELMNSNFLIEDIEKLELTEETDGTVYQLTYTEDHRTSIINQNIENLESQIETLTSDNADDFAIAALEQALIIQQNTVYTDKTVQLKVNKENILIHLLTEDTFETTTDGTVHESKMTSEKSIDEYNDPSINIDVDI